jgi:hypothetical protein
MLAGALISWGVMWPVLNSKQGEWFPANLAAWDVRGLYGYQLSLAVALVAADGLHALCYAAAEWLFARTASDGRRTCDGDGGSRWRRGAGKAKAAAAGTSGPPARVARRHGKAAAGGGSGGDGGGSGSGGGGAGRRAAARRGWQAEALAAIENDALSDASNLQFGLASVERGLRRHVFMSEDMRLLAPCAAAASAVLLVAAVFALPPLLAPLQGVRWWHLLAAAAAAPLVALANARAAGATDVAFAPAFASAAAALAAAWAGTAGAGLAAGGLVLGVTQSAAQMGYSFAAGYTVMASPTAVFAAHILGCLSGAVLAPLAHLLVSSAPAAAAGLPSPLAAPVLAAADAFAASGAGALPAYATWLALAALVVGLLLAGARGAMRSRVRALVPMPVVMGVIFLSGANIAGECVR